MSWPQRKVSSVVDVRLGRQRSPARASGPNMVPYLRAANVTDGRLDLTDIKTMDFTPAEQDIFALRSGDVLVTEGSGSLATVGATAVYRGELPEPVCFQNTLLRLRPKTDDLDPAFLAWWARGAFESGTFATIATGANIHHLGADGVKSLSIPMPPREAQRRVVEGLDHVTQRLVDVHGTNERLLMLLQERRTAVAAHAVSGHDKRPLKTMVASVQGGEWGAPAGESDRDVRCYRAADFDRRRHRLSPGLAPLRSLTDAQYRANALAPGDLILEKSGGGPTTPVGCSVLVGPSDVCHQDAVCTNFTARLRPAPDCVPDYLQVLLAALHRTGQLMAFIKQTTGIQNLDMPALLQFRVPCPAPPEQVELARWVQETWSALDALEDRIRAQNELLAERRRALITAAVTGQLDLQEAA